MNWWPITPLLVVASLGLAGMVYLTLRWRTRALRLQSQRLRAEIAQRHGVEAALRRSHTHYRTVFESAPDGLIIVRRGKIQEANPAARELFADDDLVGKPVADHLSWDSDQGDGWTVCTRGDGSTFHAAIGQHSFGEEGRLFTISDVSGLVQAQEARRQLEAELAHAHRLEAIGRLAGGVAHDFNNMLTALAGGAEVLRSGLVHADSASEVAEVISDLDAVVRRGSQLTGQLLSFGRRQDLVTKVIDLKEEVRQIQPMLRRALRDDVVLTLSLPNSAVHVVADATQLELSLLNLVLNAGEAQPDGGEVRIHLAMVMPEGDMPALPVDAVGWALICVDDDGMGIPVEQQAHVFEPFFSTRGEGSGLGLAAVHGFAIQSGGWLELRSVVGRGSSFRLGLPLVQESVDLPSDPPTPIDNEGLMGAKILVVDDNVEVLRVMKRVLSRAQFDVVTTSDPRQAITLSRTDVFDLVVTDVIMPDLRGPDLVQILRQSRPRQRVLYVSAYTDLVDPSSMGDTMLHKPFSTQDLLRAVRDELI